MRYAVKAEFMKDFEAPRRLVRWPILRALWRAVAAFIVALSYLGAFTATTLAASMPSQLVRVHGTNRELYVSAAAMNLACILILCIIFGRRVWRGLRIRFIDVDLLVMFLGLLLAFSFVACTILDFEGWVLNNSM